MGRAIRKVPSQTFLDMENAKIPPPYPRAGYAWIGIVFWNKQLSTQQYIWFVKLPVDEQGMLIPAARNHYLQIIVDALGNQLEQAEDKNGQLPENPYSFVPSQHQLADFNSISRRSLSLGQSGFYQEALSYINSPGELPWQAVPLQGIADVAAQCDDDAVRKVLISHFDDLAEQVKFGLLTSLENHKVDIQLAETIERWLLANRHPVAWQNGLRSLSQSPCKGLVERLVDTCLEDGQLSNDLPLLTVIGGRLWHYLEQPERLRAFFELIAEHDEKAPVFAAVYADLVKIPSLRPHVLAMLRWPEKSAALTTAVGKLFSGQ